MSEADIDQMQDEIVDLKDEVALLKLENSRLKESGESREKAIVAALNAAKERISVLEAALVGVRLIVEGVSHARQATPGA